ncbi:MAG: O-antigen ligase family protein [Peptococcaceae bacterium]|jgi:O-antigen ligase|nr:O-antigen ligase family protein [Peptococcaceae bacterium]
MLPLFWQWLLLLVTIEALVLLGWKKPSLLIPFLAGAAALEISITWYPSLGGLETALGGDVSLVKLTSIALILAALARLCRRRDTRRELGALVNSWITWALVIYVGVGGVSVLYSADRHKTAVEVIRLLVLLALYLAVGLLSQGKQKLLPLYAVHTLGCLLTPLVIFEAATRHFIWQQQFAEGVLARPPATFVDANILARYLVLALVANLVLQYFAEGWRARSLYQLAMAALAGALAATFSRSGYVTLAVVFILLAVLVPRRKILLPLGLLGVLAALILAGYPTMLQRLLTIKEGIGALDAQRQYLVQAAWAMFREQPLTGVGLGAFQTVFLAKYLFMKTVEDGATLSHTTVMTIAAELGLLGLAAMANVWAALIRLIGRTRRRLGREEWIVGAAYGLWILTIFISSQAEARFFEEPLLWVSMGMLYRLSLGGAAGGAEKT